MSDWLQPERFQVPVRGGELTVGQWGDSGPQVLAIHGITTCHMQWPLVGRELQDEMRVIAPDLRGRGGSGELPGPFGMKAHADDMVAVLDHLDIDRAVVVGHSMGGYVAAVLAMYYPERVSSLVLIDGGFTYLDPPGPDVDIEQILVATIGPSVERCKTTFESLDAAFDFWKQHPALQDEGAWNEGFKAYISYELKGESPALRSKTSIDAVMGDARDLLAGTDAREAPDRIVCPMLLIRAPRGILNQPAPIYPDDAVAGFEQKYPDLKTALLDDLNHFTLVTAERGAKQVAQHIREAFDREPIAR